MTRCNVLFTPHPRSNNKLCSLYSRGLYFSGQEKHLLQNDCLPIRRRSVHSRNDQYTRRCIAGRIERLLFFRQRAKRSQVIIDIQTYGRPSLAAVCSLSLSLSLVTSARCAITCKINALCQQLAIVYTR